MATTVSMQLGRIGRRGDDRPAAQGARRPRGARRGDRRGDDGQGERRDPLARRRGIVEQIVVQEGDVVPGRRGAAGDRRRLGLAAQRRRTATRAGAAPEAVPAASPARPWRPRWPRQPRRQPARAPVPSWRTRPPPRAAPPGGPPGGPGPDSGGSDGAPKRASPFVRSLARKYGINLAQVNGSGLGGRVTKDDILAFIEQRGAQPVAEAGPVASHRPPPPLLRRRPAARTTRSRPRRRSGRSAAPAPPRRPGSAGRGAGPAHADAPRHRRAHGQERPDGAARLGHDRDRRLAAGQARPASSPSGSAARASS